MRLLLAACTTALLLTGLPALLSAAETGDYYIGSGGGTELRDAPRASASILARLPRHTAVEPLERRRNWRRVRVELDGETRTGWIPEVALRERYRAEAREEKESSFLSRFSSWFRGPDTPEQTAVLGVRGLEEGGELGSARAPEAAVDWMESLRVSDAEVNRFVREGDLNP